MPYAKLEPSGCGIHKGRAKLRIDLFLEVGDPNYDKAHAFVVDETCPEFKAGYKGKLDAEGNPDFADYEKWRDGLPHVWRDNPFHSHFIYPDKEATDADIKAQIDRTLNYFYTFHQEMWDTDKKFIDEWKKVPKVKGSIRDVFVKGDPKDRVFNEQKVADVLSRQADFWVGVSRVPPIDLNIGEKGTIDVGSEAINRDAYQGAGRTFFDLDNPADGTGSIDTVQIFPASTMGGCKVGTFFLISGTTYECRDLETIGDVTAGDPDPDVFTGLDMGIVTDDLLGCYNATGTIQRTTSGTASLYIYGDYITAERQTAFSASTRIFSLYGTGTESGGGVVVTPGAFNLTLTPKTPVVTASDHKTVTPGKVDMSITNYAPVVTASDHKEVIPGTVALTLTPKIPEVTASDFKLVTPGVLPLTLTPHTPTISVTGNKEVVPGTFAMTLTPYAPVITASDHKEVVPSVVTLTLTPKTPVVTASDHKEVIPGTLALIMTPNAPVITASDKKVVTPGALAMTLTTLAPSIFTPVVVTPGTVALTLTPYTPTISATGSVIVTPGPVNLTLTPHTPNIYVPIVVTPGTLEMILTTFKPTITASEFIIITANCYFHKRSADQVFHGRSADQVFHDREANVGFKSS